jgi:hypothetical protein
LPAVIEQLFELGLVAGAAPAPASALLSDGATVPDIWWSRAHARRCSATKKPIPSLPN